ncbi:MAG: sigma factor-like helix-turn-helix DNA-binding protein [bacterium]
MNNNFDLDKENRFNPVDVISSMFKNLLKREQEVLRRRFALDGITRDTLEKIGREYAITRERVRQIEASGIRKIKAILKEEKEKLNINIVESNIENVLSEHGGLMREDLMIENTLDRIKSVREDRHRKNLLFLITQLLEEHEKLMKAEANINHESFWYLKEVDVERIKQSIITLVNFLASHGNPVVLEELINKMQPNNDSAVSFSSASDYLYKDENFKDDKFKNFVLAQLYISKSLDQNILGQWGLIEWNTIIPRRMNDKIYLVLRKENRPLHFTEISKKINEMDFDKKKAYPATVHNELILDNKYILVGRGVYALREWGYTDGTVADVIQDVIKKEAKAFSKEEIIDEVLKQRMVRKATVVLSLNDRKKFKIDEDGKYSLA